MYIYTHVYKFVDTYTYGMPAYLSSYLGYLSIYVSIYVSIGLSVC